MYVDLLTDEENDVFAVDCVLTGSYLRVGALFVGPNLTTTAIRFLHNGEVFVVEFPESQLNQPDAAKAWDVDLPVLTDPHDQLRHVSIPEQGVLSDRAY